MKSLQCSCFALIVAGCWFAPVLYAETMPEKGIQNPDVAHTNANETAIKEFGIKKGEPIDNGFFFWNGEFVTPPYVVERRGLGIYINDKCIDKGPKWSSLDFVEVKEDPGDPPVDVSPFEMNQSSPRYWTKKWKYLRLNYPPEKAKQMMFDVYTRSFDVAKAVRNGDDVVITNKKGESSTIDMSMIGYSVISLSEARELYLNRQETNRNRREGQLSSGMCLGTRSKETWDISDNKSLLFIEILLSGVKADDKIRQIMQVVWHVDISSYTNVVTLLHRGEIQRVEMIARSMMAEGRDKNAKDVLILMQQFPIFEEVVRKCSPSDALKKEFEKAKLKQANPVSGVSDSASDLRKKYGTIR